MPRGDGTGPRGQGPGTGRGRGQQNQRGGRMGGPQAAGPGGICLCPNCGQQIPHTTGLPCSQIQCPQCGSNMARA